MFISIESFENEKFLYNTECNTVFEYNEFLYNVFSDEAVNIPELQSIFVDIDVNEQINTLKVLRGKCQQTRERKKKADSSGYHTLWLNIAHECNLNCIYCYGEGGNYHKQHKLLDFKMAKKIIDYWIHHIDSAAKELKVIFFGGEPLVNKEILIECVAYINSILSDKFLLKYGVTTNATLIDDEILKLFRENHFNVTLSVDGGEETQNRNRPYKDGKGSYEIVKKNLQLIKNVFPILVVRMTLIHADVDKVMERVEELWDLGANNIAFEIVETGKEGLAISQRDVMYLEKQIELLAKKTFENIVHGKNEIIVDFIKYGRILHNQFLNICSFYDNRALKVDPEGEIFRCHRLVGKNKFTVGNLFEKQEILNDDMEEILCSKCEKCWAKNICVRCPQENILKTGDINKPDNISCQIKRKMIYESLKLYVSLFKGDKKLFKKIYF